MPETSAPDIHDSRAALAPWAQADVSLFLSQNLHRDDLTPSARTRVDTLVLRLEEELKAAQVENLQQYVQKVRQGSMVGSSPKAVFSLVQKISMFTEGACGTFSWEKLERKEPLAMGLQAMRLETLSNGHLVIDVIELFAPTGMGRPLPERYIAVFDPRSGQLIARTPEDEHVYRGVHGVTPDNQVVMRRGWKSTSVDYVDQFVLWDPIGNNISALAWQDFDWAWYDPASNLLYVNDITKATIGVYDVASKEMHAIYQRQELDRVVLGHFLGARPDGLLVFAGGSNISVVDPVLQAVRYRTETEALDKDMIVLPDGNIIFVRKPALDQQYRNTLYYWDVTTPHPTRLTDLKSKARNPLEEALLHPKDQDTVIIVERGERKKDFARVCAISLCSGVVIWEQDLPLGPSYHMAISSEGDMFVGVNQTIERFMLT